jgi:hypothetical protein
MDYVSGKKNFQREAAKVFWLVVDEERLKLPAKSIKM